MALTDEQRRQIAELVEKRRRALIAELLEDAGRARDQPYAEQAGEVRDAGDESVAALLIDLGQADMTRDLDELRALEAARERLAAKDFGTCADCGSEIDFERLKAAPHALRCVRCQERHERTFAGSGQPRL
jgi:RNA polymerase-binding transcription factor DksA